MKTTKRSKAIVSIVLVLMMLVSVLTIGFVSVNAAGGLTLTYNFKYKNAGYAEGRIELKAATTADQGTYYLYWANDTKALDGYAPISTVALNTTVKYVELGEFIAIPADATKVIAVKSTSSNSPIFTSITQDITHTLSPTSLLLSKLLRREVPHSFQPAVITQTTVHQPNGKIICRPLQAPVSQVIFTR